MFYSAPRNEGQYRGTIPLLTASRSELFSRPILSDYQSPPGNEGIVPRNASDHRHTAGGGLASAVEGTHGSSDDLGRNKFPNCLHEVARFQVIVNWKDSCESILNYCYIHLPNLYGLLASGETDKFLLANLADRISDKQCIFQNPGYTLAVVRFRPAVVDS